MREPSRKMTKISLSQLIIMKLSPTWFVEKDTVLACGFLTHPGTNWFVNDRILVLIMKCCSIEHLLCRGFYSTRKRLEKG